MNVGGGLVAVDERHDMRVMEALEDIDLGREVVLQLFVEL